MIHLTVEYPVNISCSGAVSAKQSQGSYPTSNQVHELQQPCPLGVIQIDALPES